MELQVSGTKSEHLLKHLSGVAGRRIRAHLRGAACTQEFIANDLIHIYKLRKLDASKEEDWMGNLLVAGREPVDELADLRREARQAGGESPVESMEPADQKKKKAKKEKKKEKIRGREDRKEKSPEGVERSRRRSRELGPS